MKGWVGRDREGDSGGWRLSLCSMSVWGLWGVWGVGGSSRWSSWWWEQRPSPQATSEESRDDPWAEQ